MCKTNNVIDGELYCDFVHKEPDGKFVCALVEKLKLADEGIDIGATVDKNLATPALKTAIGMSDVQADWCLGELDYPNPKVSAHTPPNHIIHDKHPLCTYRMVEE